MMGLSQGAAPPSGGVVTSVLMHVSHPSPGFGADGDDAHADDAQALAQAPTGPQAHVKSAFANV